MADKISIFLRRETYGAVAYDPKAGHYYHLGQEAVHLLVRPKESASARALIRAITDIDARQEDIELKEIVNPGVQDGRLSAPLKAFVNITKNCNLRCKHCYNNSGGFRSPELEYGEIVELLKQLESRGTFLITLAGGEPLFHPNIESILRFLGTTNLSVSIITNAIDLPEAAISALSSMQNIRSVTVSIDGGTAKDNDQVRGRGSFEKALQGIVRLQESTGIPIAVRTTLMQNNIACVHNLLEFLASAKIAEWKINRLNPYGRAARYPHLLLDERQFRKAAEYLVRQASQYNIRVQIPSFKYQQDAAGQVGLCRAGEETVEIDADGHVYPCSFTFGGLSAGNIRLNSYEDIWAKLRNHSINNGLCLACRGRGGKQEKTFGYVPDLMRMPTGTTLSPY